MSNHESRPDIHGYGISRAGLPLQKMMSLLQEGIFEQLLIDESFQDFFDSLGSIDLDGTDFENPRKVFLQIYFKDPSKDKLLEGESAWMGCEYDIWGQDDEEIYFIFRYLTMPEAGDDPMFNPELQDHVHLTIGDHEINWDKLASD